MYKDLKGNVPSRDKIKDLSEELNLKENQIYKWFWDTKKKIEEDEVLAANLSNNQPLFSPAKGGGDQSKM